MKWALEVSKFDIETQIKSLYQRLSPCCLCGGIDQRPKNRGGNETHRVLYLEPFC